MFGSLCRAVMTGIVTLVLISACSSSSNTYRPQPTVTQGTEPVSLLFAHVSTCPHCRYEMPIIAEFEKKYPWVTVIHKNYFDLSREEQALIAGTSGHPVMVFFTGNSTCKRQIIGETSLTALETQLDAFQHSIPACKAGATAPTETYQMGSTCR